MAVLRLRQISEGENRYRVLLDLEEQGRRRTAESRFTFEVNGQDQEDLRWYLEDYLQYPLDPAPTIAARIEKRMAEIGVELFRAVLEKTPVWQEVRRHLNETRIEIATEVREATTIPWELLRDPETDVPLALGAQAFIRSVQDAVVRAEPPQSQGGPIRVLLVISRPRGGEDVAFRSVARRLVEGFRGNDAVRLTVLRPPTYERLAFVLRDAKAKGEPFHLVHFDGHGMWTEDGPREGGHGYLLFENPALEGNRQPVDGPALGGLLKETGAPVLVLNACQSAYAQPPAQPVAVSAMDPHEEARAFGSLGQEVMDAGATGVVAMRYSVFVDTAAEFMAGLYDRLAQGDGLGEAASFSRKQLQARPRPLQDWVVPVVFEAEPVKLFSRPSKAGELKIELGKPGALELEGLPPRPDAGFFGRDETLLALDRAFDTQRVVLLQAFAGSGKTAAAAEFARWYHETGGIEGPVLFTSFQHHKPLARVLDDFAAKFGAALERAAVHWLTLDDPQRREVALQVLGQVPVLWIWDNVEPVTGFPKGVESKWSRQEQDALADFLRAASVTKARLLLTSRRDEREWLGGLPRRIPVPRMPFGDRVELARALAEKHGRRFTEVEDWRPLLEFTQGNPLSITVLVGQALRDGLRTGEQVEAFVARLRSGEAVVEDEEEEGRMRSLAASLSYGFEHAFNEAERKQLALLHLFQGFVDVDALCWMGKPDAESHLPEVRGLTREAGILLLDRAAEVGLLTAIGGGYYAIHPALPWFFRGLFEEHYPDGRERALRAYVKAIGKLGDVYHDEYEAGNREVIAALSAEEDNLLHARAVARRQGWWPQLIGTMQGLRWLYDRTGRRSVWARLVEETVPDFVDTATDGLLPGREEEWSLVTQYRVGLAREWRQWAEAERLQNRLVECSRQHARDGDAPRLRNLAASLHELGQIQRESGRAECVQAYQEDFDLVMRIGDRPGAAVSAFNLGNAYLTLPPIRDLDEAERWYCKTLELVAEGDRLGQGRCQGQLGSVALERFDEARTAKKTEAELLRHLNDARRRYQGALGLVSDSVEDLAGMHNQLGGVYFKAGNLYLALHHLRESIRHMESAGNLYDAGKSRGNVARVLAQQRRFADARDYAEAALRDFQTYGAGAAEEVQKTLELIAQIDKDARGSGPGDLAGAEEGMKAEGGHDGDEDR